VAILALLCGVLPAYGQSWDTVAALAAGDRVKVLDSAGKVHSGVLNSVSAEAISLRADNGELSIERSRVRRVQVRSASRRATKAVIGALIGVAVGAVVDQSLGAYLRNESNESGAARAFTYIAPIALFGGVAGAFPSYRTVYRAR
jgi:hypothetical protein